MLKRGRVAAALACAAVCLPPAAALGGVPAWTTYRHDPARSGIDPDSSSPAAPVQAWQTPALDGQVWAEPLVYGSHVYVATENDTVYALDLSTGAVAWAKHLASAVPSTQLPCGDITPSVGITSTPVIDPSSGRIYVVADTWNGTSASHRLYGLSLSDGSIASGPVGVDPPGSVPLDQLQRAGLALDAGKVIIGYGGNDGDCGDYHGWLVAVPEGGGALQTFEVDRGTREGAIWGSGNAPAIDSAGDIWVSTGNGSGGWDYQESVVKLDSNLNVLGHWSPSNWAALDSGDTDLGSSMPVLLPGGLVFEIGKAGVGYLLNASSLGGTGAPPLYSGSVCSGSWGGGIYVAGVIYVTCSDGLHALTLNASARRFSAAPAWSVNGAAVGPPIFAGGLVWSVGTSVGASGGGLYGLDPRTGATSFYADLRGYQHFATPSAGGGFLFIANQAGGGSDQLTALRIVNPTPAPPAILRLRARANRGKLRLRVTLSEPATVTIAVSRLERGRRLRGHCRAGAKHGRRCRLWVRWLSRHRRLGGGLNGLRLRTRRLPAGSYLITVSASGPGGSSRPRQAVITVRRGW